MNEENKNPIIPRIISYLFIPPIMNLISFIFLSIKVEETKGNQIKSIIISFLFGLVIPIIYFVIKRKKGRIDDDDARIKEQRSNPYLFGVSLTIIAAFLSILFKLHVEITILWVVYLINSMLLFIINKYWKISAHAMGVAIPLGVVIYYSKYATIILSIILLAISWSRIKLKIHNLSQVIAGALTGFLITVLIFQII